jgi:hypothetical protein
MSEQHISLPQVKRMRQFIQQEWWAHIQSCSVCDGKIRMDGSAPCAEAERLANEIRRWSKVDMEMQWQRLAEKEA